MAIEAMQTNHELETLRIVRPQEQPRRKRSRLVSIAILMLLLTVLGAASYVIYAKTIGRSPTVQTMMVVARTDRQSSVLLTGSGYIVTRHKYITIGTKILGQIVEEPIEEGQRAHREETGFPRLLHVGGLPQASGGPIATGVHHGTP